MEANTKGYEFSWNERLMAWEIRDNNTHKIIPFDEVLDRGIELDENYFNIARDRINNIK